MININKKKILSLLLTGNIVLCHLPYANAEFNRKGDRVRSTTVVNIRDNDSLDGEIIGSLKKNTIVKRILSSDNGWDLIEYNGKIGFVKNDYLEQYSYENIYCDLDFIEERKILGTKEKCAIYINPFVESNKIANIDENKIVNVLALTSNNWYLINYNGVLGFIESSKLESINYETTQKVVVPTGKEVNIRSKPSTKSDKLNILYANDSLPYVRDYNKYFYVVDYYGYDAYISKDYAKVEQRIVEPYDFIKLVCLKDDAPLYSFANKNSSVITYLSKYETGEVISIEGDYYFIKTLDNYGYIHKNNVSTINEMVIVIDLSSQKLMVYKNRNCIFESNIVTGKDSSPTYEGKYHIQDKETGRYLTGENYNVYVDYWMQYNNNYGIHDYKMNGNYGGNIYQKNGSHGCVRLEKKSMEELYNLVKKKTLVIIHK